MGKTAYWIQKTHIFRDDEYICSACRSSFDAPYAECPACGRRMRRSKYDPNWVDELELLDMMD